MLYVLDTNVLITARDQYYGFDQVPEFWEWLLHQAKMKRIGLPREVLDEILDGKPHHGKDLLYQWAKGKDNESILDLGEADIAMVQHVLAYGYSSSLTEDQVGALRADPFVIAHALADRPNRCVVSNENVKPKRQAHNRKMPDACAKLNIQCIPAAAFIRALNFSTNWKSGQ